MGFSFVNHPSLTEAFLCPVSPDLNFELTLNYVGFALRDGRLWLQVNL